MKRLLILFLLFLTACTQSIPEIKDEEYIGKTVLVEGTVTKSVKIGPLSGFVLEDKDRNVISVSSDSLPAEGEKVLVKGVLLKDTIFQYYIKADKIS